MEKSLNQASWLQYGTLYKTKNSLNRSEPKQGVFLYNILRFYLILHYLLLTANINRYKGEYDDFSYYDYEVFFGEASSDVKKLRKAN